MARVSPSSPASRYAPTCSTTPSASPTIRPRRAASESKPGSAVAIPASMPASRASASARLRAIITGEFRVLRIRPGSRPTAAQWSASTPSLWLVVARSPRMRLHMSAYRATSRSVRRSPLPPTRIGGAPRATPEGRQVEAVGAVLGLVVAGPDPEDRPAGGDDVEGRHHLRHQGRVAVGDRGDQRAQAEAAGAGGEAAQQRVRLQHRVGGRAVERDLEEVVHGEERVEAGPLGRDGDLGRPLEDPLVADARVLEGGEIEAEEWHGVPLTVRRRGSISGGAQAPCAPLPGTAPVSFASRGSRV